MAQEQFANLCSTTLNGAIITAPASGVQETWTVASTALPFPQSPQFRILVDSEILLVNGVVNATQWTVLRGQEGTTPVTHVTGTPVTHVLTANSIQQLGIYVTNTTRTIANVNFSILPNDGTILVNNTTTTVTGTLPQISTLGPGGLKITIKKICVNDGTHYVQINTSGSDTIDGLTGVTTFSIIGYNHAFVLVADPSANTWRIESQPRLLASSCVQVPAAITGGFNITATWGPAASKPTNPYTGTISTSYITGSWYITNDNSGGVATGMAVYRATGVGFTDGNGIQYGAAWTQYGGVNTTVGANVPTPLWDSDATNLNNAAQPGILATFATPPSGKVLYSTSLSGGIKSGGPNVGLCVIDYGAYPSAGGIGTGFNASRVNESQIDIRAQSNTNWLHTTVRQITTYQSTSAHSLVPGTIVTWTPGWQVAGASFATGTCVLDNSPVCFEVWQVD